MSGVCVSLSPVCCSPAFSLLRNPISVARRRFRDRATPFPLREGVFRSIFRCTEPSSRTSLANLVRKRLHARKKCLETASVQRRIGICPGRIFRFRCTEAVSDRKSEKLSELAFMQRADRSPKRSARVFFRTAANFPHARKTCGMVANRADKAAWVMRCPHCADASHRQTIPGSPTR